MGSGLALINGHSLKMLHKLVGAQNKHFLNLLFKSIPKHQHCRIQLLPIISSQYHKTKQLYILCGKQMDKYNLPKKLSSNSLIALSAYAHQVLRSATSGNSIANSGVTYTNRFFHACTKRKVLDYVSIVKGLCPAAVD